MQKRLQPEIDLHLNFKKKHSILSAESLFFCSTEVELRASHLLSSYSTAPAFPLALLSYFFAMRSHYVTQAGLELLGSKNFLASFFLVPGACHYTWPQQMLKSQTVLLLNYKRCS
jgi:hypothetical protein